MPATFELKTNSDNEFFFNLVDGEEVLLMSGEYPNKETATQGIAEVRTGSLMGHQIAAGKVPAGDTFFVIKDAHGQIIAKSQLFNSQMLFDSTLHRVKDSACIAEIADLT